MPSRSIFYSPNLKFSGIKHISKLTKCGPETQAKIRHKSVHEAPGLVLNVALPFVKITSTQRRVAAKDKWENKLSYWIVVEQFIKVEGTHADTCVESCNARTGRRSKAE
eukprot:2740449-Amphidinium_carterae.2